MKVFFLKILTWFALKGRLYYIWSKLYRFLWEGVYKGLGMPQYECFEDLREVIAAMKWRKDTWIMLFDAISRVEATWHRHLHGQPAGDCDDISIFAVDRILEMTTRTPSLTPTLVLDKEGKALKIDVCSIGLLSVPWVDRNGETGGHNVGVFRYRIQNSGGEFRWEWAHVSNWSDGRILKGFPTLKSVVIDVLDGRTSLGWARANLRLKLKEYHWK